MQARLTSPRARRRAAVWFAAAVLALLALFIASRIPRTLTVFLIAAFIAFGVQPVVSWLERWLPRVAAIAVVYVALLGSFVVVALLVVPATLSQVQTLAVNAPAFVDTIGGWLDGAQSMLHQKFGSAYLPPGYADLRSLLAAKVSAGLSASLASLTDILVNAFTAIFIAVSALVLSAFFLVQGRSVADSAVNALPVNRRTEGRALASELASVFGAYVSGQLVLCTITGALIYALTALTGFKFALLVGLLSGVAYAVPFVGQIFAHAIALVLAAPQGPREVVWVQIIVFVVARVSDNLLVPKIMSESVGVSPIVVMFAVFAGGELFGLPGLLLGIPVAALAKVAWRFYRRSRAIAGATQPDASATTVAPTGAVAAAAVVAPQPAARVVEGVEA